MRSRGPQFERVLVTAFALAAVAGPSRAQVEPFDPWEPANRGFYAIHQVIDRFILAPVSRAYGHLPRPVRKAVRNFGRNLSEPGIAVNDVLQGHPGKSAGTLGRFVVNSTIGVGGLVDVAKRGGLQHHNNDFGTTLGRWGAQPGPYMFLPILGPSDLRDSVGGVINIFLSPTFWVHYPSRTEIGV